MVNTPFSKISEPQPAQIQADFKQAAETDPMHPDWTTLTSQALDRVREYMHTSIREEAAHVAALDASNGILFKTLFRLELAVDDALRDCTDPADRMEAVKRSIDLMPRLTRQIDRLSHVRILLRKAAQALPDNGSRA